MHEVAGTSVKLEEGDWPGRRSGLQPPPVSPISHQLISNQGTNAIERTDADAEYADIMTKALTTYRDVREKERIQNINETLGLGSLRTAYPLPQRTKKPANVNTRGPRLLGLVNIGQEVPDTPRARQRPRSAIQVPVDARLQTVTTENFQYNPRHRILRATSAPPKRQSQFKTFKRPSTADSNMSLPNMRDIGNSPNLGANKRYSGGFFKSNQRQQYYTIHPDWVSESLQVHKIRLSGRKLDLPEGNCVDTGRCRKSNTLPNRRCKSAPPPRNRNIITWQ